MRKSLALSIALTISLIGLNPTPAQATGTDGTYPCSVSGNFTVTAGVVEHGATCSGVADIPVGATYISDTAFNNSNVTSVTIPASVTYISGLAFAGASLLTDVTFDGLLAPNADPSAFTGTGGSGAATGHIQATATGFGPSGGNWKGLVISRAPQAGMMADGFFDCSSGTRVSASDTPNLAIEGSAVTFGADCAGVVAVPEGVTRIEEEAFNYSNATTVSLPNSLRSIGGYAFYHAYFLESISLGTGLTTIGENAFNRATSLVSVTIPATVTSIGQGVFRQAVSLTTVTIEGDIDSIPDNAFRGDVSLTSLVIPSTVTSIGNYAFAYAETLNSVTIPNGVTSIGEYAFTATMLASARLPSTLTSLGVGVFSSSYLLADVNLPWGMTSIPDSAFQGTAITEALIPGSVTSIGGYAFANTPLASIQIPTSVTSIGQAAFNGASALTSIVIPQGVTEIPTYAFENASSLRSVTLPAGVTTIGMDVFSGASSLSSVYFLGNAPATVASQNLYDVPTSARVRVQPTATGFGSDWNGIAVDFAAANGSYVCSTGVISSSTAAPRYAIGNGEVYAGSDCTGAVVIPANVPTIANGAFSGSSLTSITIPATVTTIVDGAFFEADSLTSINVTQGNSSYSSIDGVLFDAAGTKLVYYPAGKTAASYAIPAGVTSIGYLGFFRAPRLETVSFPTGFTTLGIGAFATTSALTTIVIPNGVTRIPAGAFSESIALASITLPNGLTSIDEYAFSGATALSSITIPSSVTFLGDGAFDSASSLASVEFLGNAPLSVGTQVFDGVAVSAEAVVGPSATGFGANGSNWNGLTIRGGSGQIQNQNQNQNQNNSQQNNNQTAPAATAPAFAFTSRPLVSTNGQGLTLRGEHLADVISVTVGGKVAKISKKSDGELVITVPAGSEGFPELVVVHASGTTIMQGFIQAVKPYAEKRSLQIRGFKNGLPTKASIAALKKSYLAGIPANVVSCLATVTSNASVKDVVLATKSAKATCQAMADFSSYINTVNVQVSKTGKAGSKLVMDVTFDRTPTGK